MIEPPNLIGVWRHIRQHIEQKRYSEALDNLKLYGELERAYALAVMEQQRESTASEKTDRTAAQPDMTEQLAEALENELERGRKYYLGLRHDGKTDMNYCQGVLDFIGHLKAFLAQYRAATGKSDTKENDDG